MVIDFQNLLLSQLESIFHQSGFSEKIKEKFFKKEILGFKKKSVLSADFYCTLDVSFHSEYYARGIEYHFQGTARV